jgi:hypothetical protein
VTTIAAAGDIIAGGAVTFGAARTGTLTTAGDITTTNDNITLTRAVTLGGAVALDTGANAGNILFSSTVDNTQSLTLNAGTTGDITFTGAVGGNTPLGPVTVTAANNVTITSTFVSASFTQTAGSGTTDFGTNSLTSTGDVTVRTTSSITGTITAHLASLTAGEITGSVFIDGTLTLNASIVVLGNNSSVGGFNVPAESIILTKVGTTGPFTFNGKIIGVNESDLDPDIPDTPEPGGGGPATTPAQAVFGANITQSAFTVNVFEVDFALVESGGAEGAYEGLPFVTGGFWKNLLGETEEPE